MKLGNAAIVGGGGGNLEPGNCNCDLHIHMFLSFLSNTTSANQNPPSSAQIHTIYFFKLTFFKYLASFSMSKLS